MERLRNIAQLNTSAMPDSFFWYTLCVLLIGFVMWVAKTWLDNNKGTFEQHGELIKQMGKCITELTTMTKVHEIHIQHLLKEVDEQKESIQTLRDFYIVTYKK